MCGGIAGALTFSLPQDIRNHRLKLATYILTYNLGRITIYAVVGAIVGALGSNLLDWISPRYGHFILQLLAATLMILMGLYLAGWFPRLTVIERLGKPLWARLEPVGKRLIPVHSHLHAYFFGLIWGWLPCGLVYTTLAWSTTSGSALDGALLMSAFGLGTLPSVMAAGIVTGIIARISKLPYVRMAAGIIIILIALVTLYVSLGYSHDSSTHAEHQHMGNKQ
jgi:sulfite exporter TauE/SafE